MTTIKGEKRKRDKNEGKKGGLEGQREERKRGNKKGEDEIKMRGKEKRRGNEGRIKRMRMSKMGG